MKIIFFLIFIFSSSLVQANSSDLNYILPAPPNIKEDRKLYNYLNNIYTRWNILQVTTSNPNGNIESEYGQQIIYFDGASYNLAVETTSPRGTTWTWPTSSGSGTVGIGTTGRLAIYTGTTTVGSINTPTLCSAGNYPLGIDVSGNATGCTAAAGGGSGTVGIGTTGWNAIYATDGNTVTASTVLRTVGNNIGIGSATPGSVLDVQGTTRTTGFQLNLNPSAGFIMQGNSVGVGTWVNASTLAVAAGGLGAVQYNSPVGTLAGTETVFSMNGTNVGIGTTNGIQLFDVRGREIVVGNIGIGTILYSNFVTTAPPSGGMIIEKNVGIGTINPRVLLDVRNGNVGIGSFNTTSHALLEITNDNIGVDYDLFRGNDGINDTGPIIIDKKANVGIGTTTSGSFKLETVGQINATNGLRVENIGHTTIYFAADPSTTEAVDIGDGNHSTALLSVDGASISGTPGPNISSTARTATLGGAITTYRSHRFQGNTLNSFSGTDFANVYIDDAITGTTTFNSNNALYVAAGDAVVFSGNIGIGTKSPANSLIVGTGNVGVGSFHPGTSVDVQGTVRALGFSGPGAGITGITAGPAGGQNAVQYNNGTVTAGTETVFSMNGTNVGIGTTDGNVGFDVRNLSNFTGNIGINTTKAANGLGIMNGNIGIGTWVPGNSLVIKTGNVGIGTLLPGVGLDIAASVNSGLRVTATGGSAFTKGVIDTNGMQLGSNAVRNNFAILQISPTATTSSSAVTSILSEARTITLSGNVTTGAGNRFEAQTINSAGSAHTNYGTVYIAGAAAGTAPITNNSALWVDTGNVVLGNTLATTNVGINTVKSQTALSVMGNIGIGTITAGGGALIVSSAALGNVGIGSAWPGTALDVQGTMRLLGTGAGSFTVQVGANTACTTTCTTGKALFGFDDGTLGVTLPHLVGPADATAEECLCGG